MTLKQAKEELRNAWVNNEFKYDTDETFIVCYKNGSILDTKEANKKLPLSNIIGIQFCGSNAHYCVGHEMHKGIAIPLVDQSDNEYIK